MCFDIGRGSSLTLKKVNVAEKDKLFHILTSSAYYGILKESLDEIYKAKENKADLKTLREER